MILDNIIIFLNVLEQFAIRVTIFNVNIEDLINYVNKLYFSDDNIIKNLDFENSINNLDKKIITKDFLVALDNQIINEISFNKLDFNKSNIEIILIKN